MVCSTSICSVSITFRSSDALTCVFDSGVGGLSVLKARRAELLLENFIYIADSAHAPYGERDEAYVIARSCAIAAHLVSPAQVKGDIRVCSTGQTNTLQALVQNWLELEVSSGVLYIQ